ncbi:MAG: exodeoxyribonuclease VII large subunit, partial [Candidatus Omnitrophica bacterium]|nr:exodeoxyribonuclease VII large subunit [Candidatus Omnitrophota bacterium]
MDLFDPIPEENALEETQPEQSRPLTVSELTRQVKQLLEEIYPRVWVVGEISNLRTPASGHMYFTLKDEGAELACVFFKFASQRLKFKLEDGLQVVLRGSVTVYERQGKYQLKVDTAEPKGAGALQLAFEQLKKKLAAEGLFDPEHKKPVPWLPKRIGVVTSPTGAAIRDILHVLARRMPGMDVLIAPVRVQGEEAAPEIAAAIRVMNALKNVDVLIVGRGGGSLEDLWCFNEEIVARAIYESELPVISAVGHEIDWTIADMVADVRAPTPSAAAEIV